MPTPYPLPALPGSSPVAGTGATEPGVLDGLLDDGAVLAGTPIGAALSCHRDLMSGPYRDLLGPLLVPAPAARQLREALLPADLGLPVLLVADSDAGTRDPLESVRAARSELLDEDRIVLIGVRLPLPPIDDPVLATRALLAALDLSVPAWVEVPPGPGAAAALEVLAADGAEHLSVDLTGADAGPVAAMLRRAVDLDLTFRVGSATTGVGGSGGGVHGNGATPGLLTLLCAVRAALNGAEEADLAQILAASAPDPLLSAMRRMSSADAAVSRAFLVAVQSADPAAAIQELALLGLLAD